LNFSPLADVEWLLDSAAGAGDLTLTDAEGNFVLGLRAVTMFCKS
jgi:hypothetical protein